MECRHRSYIIVPADSVRKETVGRFLFYFLCPFWLNRNCLP
ncbi:hypothetical protein HMPREF9442_00280 [Paraprevotella xylaniphila YIT 11841]|uniref:Uncharacterized protein n=1 Tax=Paraprevotella xylaniphila YIT 11841 TaxID=762982 RepID=F3QQ43_9BACT|nr:hypothetical protein HMPREF9442_00280 [Paraprevotella xylaniphila YIT 11841]